MISTRYLLPSANKWGLKLDSISFTNYQGCSIDTVKISSFLIYHLLLTRHQRKAPSLYGSRWHKPSPPSDQAQPTFFLSDHSTARKHRWIHTRSVQNPQHAILPLHPLHPALKPTKETNQPHHTISISTSKPIYSSKPQSTKHKAQSTNRQADLIIRVSDRKGKYDK